MTFLDSARIARVAGAAMLVLLLGVASVAVRAASGDYDDVYVLTATFDTVGQGVDRYSDVRLRGVPIGTVAGIDLTDDGRALVTMEIEPQHRLPQGTTAAVEALSIFGPKFIRLDPDGAPAGAPSLADGDRIEVTTGPTELQEAIDSIDGLLGAIDPEELATVLSVSARTLEEMAPAAEGFLDGTEALVGVAADRTPEGTRLLADLQRITTELDGVGERLARIARDTGETLPALTDRRAEIERLLVTGVRLAHEGSALVEDHPNAAADLPNGLAGAAFPPLALATGNLDTAPDIIDQLGVFFGTLGEVFHVVEDGQRLAAIEFYLEVDELCTDTFMPICELSP